MKKIVTICFAFMIGSSFLYKAKSQNLTAEKSIDISKKARKGYLGNVIVDDNRQQIDLVFVTKSTNRKVKFEAYQFDYDLNLINTIEDEQEADKARTKYQWFNFRGEDQYTTTGITAEMDMLGKVVFKKKEITYTYNWWTGKYKKKEKVTDKLKPSNDYGKMYFHYGYQLDQVGEALALVGTKGKLSEVTLPFTKYQVIRVNSNLDIVSQEPIDFEYIQKPIWAGPIREGAMEEDDEETGDWAMIFQPMGGQGYNKYSGPDATAYTYVRIGRDGKVVDRIEFKSKGHTWKIDGAYIKDGGVYIYGPCKKDKIEKAYWKSGDNYQILEKGFEGFQIVGFKDGKTQFVSAPGLDEFEQKNGKPADQKKPVVYNGGKINIGGFNVTKSGDIFINAQEWSYDAVGNYRGNRYKDFLIFHFNKNGELVKQYGVDNPQKTGIKGATDPRTDPKYYPTEATIFEGNDASSVYWMAYYIGKIDKQVESDTYMGTTYTTTYYIPRKQVRIGKMNTQTGDVSNFQTLGGEGNYLFNEYPTVEINGGQQLILLGENPKEKTIWLGKFDPSKL